MQGAPCSTKSLWRVLRLVGQEHEGCQAAARPGSRTLHSKEESEAWTGRHTSDAKGDAVPLWTGPEQKRLRYSWAQPRAATPSLCRDTCSRMKQMQVPSHHLGWLAELRTCWTLAPCLLSHWEELQLRRESRKGIDPKLYMTLGGLERLRNYRIWPIYMSSRDWNRGFDRTVVSST